MNRNIEELNKAKVELAELRGRLAGADELERRIRDDESRLVNLRSIRAGIEVRLRELEDSVEKLGGVVRSRIKDLSSRRDSLMREVGGELRGGRIEALRDRIERLRVS
ncbi:hypothetical protein [Vulcanisaeta souniana]|uniref:hypothetical protein n=1 Tax=Vulcanisaeta souniana TaxID=164452 RepID=UPI0006D1B5F4|nr:hypothetical protein [Vulcanisaeta souniana]